MIDVPLSGFSYPFAVGVDAGLGGPVKIDAIEACDCHGQDELEEVQDGEGDVAL